MPKKDEEMNTNKNQMYKKTKVRDKPSNEKTRKREKKKRPKRAKKKTAKPSKKKHLKIPSRTVSP